jgi:hypothetical protein
MMADEKEGLSGRGLQGSQSGGDSGEFGSGNMNQQQGADPAGGGVTASDQSNAGGSSGTGGYGSSQNVVNQRDQQPNQGAQPGLAGGGDDLRAGGGSSDGQDPGQQMSGQSRGERFDEEQGGGRGVMFDGSGGVFDIGEDQVSHQDRGQAEAAEFDKEA